jgi:glycosyltransferase involved in cell wall biosynthesis
MERPILLCLTGLARGGLETHVLTLADALRRRGDCRLHVACHFDAWFAHAARERGHSVTIVPLSGRLNPATFFRFARFVRRGGFGLIHAHDKRIALSARYAAWRLGLPLVVTQHGWVSTRRWVHFTNWIDLRLRVRGQRYVAVSQEIAARLAGVGVAPERIAAIPNSVDPLAFASLPGREAMRKAEGFGPGDFVVGTVSRLADEKRPDLLLEAFAQARKECPSARLLFVGEGPMQTELAKKARRLGVSDAVRFGGFRSDVPALLAALDVFANASRAEGTPQALLEAMWAGCPIVATRVGGVPDLVEDGAHGLLVPSGDASALARGILRLYGDPAERARLGENARLRARTEFSSDRMAERTVQVYLDALGRFPA